MFKLPNASDLATDFYTKQAALKNDFIKKLDCLIESQRFKIAGYIEAEKTIKQQRAIAEEEARNAEQLIKEII